MTKKKEVAGAFPVKMYGVICNLFVNCYTCVRGCPLAFSYYVFLFGTFTIWSLPLTAENIDFEDPVVKQICVANWDSDNDGEISKEEASVVTSIASIFKNNKSISAFTELQYFTALSSIDEYAFAESTITSVVIPGNVKSIGRFAFYHCLSLTSAIVCNGVETIGCFAFSAPLSMLSLPSSITYLDHQFIDPFVGGNTSTSGAFSFPDGVFTLYTQSQEPSSCHSNAFYRLFGVSYLIVPPGSKPAFESAIGWSNFYKILEAGDVNGDGALNIKDVVSMNAFIMGKEPSPFDERLADLNGDGNINVKDVTLMCSWIMQQNQE